MKKLFWILCLWHWNALAAQYLSTPLEILDYIESSALHYEVGQLYGHQLPYERGATLEHGIYIETQKGKEHAVHYAERESKSAAKRFEQGSAAIRYESPDYKKARKFFKKVIDEMPNHAQAHTLIGQTYYEEKKYAEAKDWLRKAMLINAVDYRAYWLMAEIYLEEHNPRAALEYICKAHVYNRNSIRLNRRVGEIFKINGLRYDSDWVFNPQYKLERQNDTVQILAEGVWLSYAMYQAVWTYEPGYLDLKRNQAVSDYLFVQEMESCLGMYITHTALPEDDPIRDAPFIQALGYAIESDLLPAYVMYEIMLPKYPLLASHITPDFMEEILLYLRQVRGKDF